AQAVALGELAEAPEVRARRLRIAGLGRHRHQAAYVVVEAQKALEVALGDARLRFLARQLDLDECRNRQAPRGGLARQRMAELAELVDGLRLPALEMADEVPAERVAVTLVLRLEVLGAVLADDLDPRLCERGQVLQVDVLDRSHDGDVRPELGPDPLVVRANDFSR